MELSVILIIPLIASALSLSPPGRRFAAPITIAATALVLLLAMTVAMQTAAAGRVDALSGQLTLDGLGAIVLALVALVGFTAALFSAGYIAPRAGHGGAQSVQRYYGLFNLFVLSMLAVPVVANVALMWIAVELTTLLSAFLVGFEDTPEALEAAWKYVVLTTLGAIFALLGFLILYWGSRVAGLEPFTWQGLIEAAPKMPPVLVWPAFLFILVGFGTKVGLVPMHTWLPDAHSQAPAPICALLSGVETTTVLYVILRLFPVIGGAPGLDARPWFIGFGLISVGVAALLLINVRDFKRMFAYSTVEHMGIILTAAGLATRASDFGAVSQMLNHSITKSLCFYVAGTVLVTLETREIKSIRGLLRVSPFMGAALLLCALAIAGAPPFPIFLSEYSILSAGLRGGHGVAVAILAILIVLAFVGIMLQVNRMAFGRPELPLEHLLVVPMTCRIAVIGAALPVVILGIYIPGPLHSLLQLAAQQLGGR
jgi:hydrogenase-4 component F